MLFHPCMSNSKYCPLGTILKNINISVKAFNFNRANYIDMNAYLDNFTDIFHGKSPNEKVDLLHKTLDDEITKFVPTYLIFGGYYNNTNVREHVVKIPSESNKAIFVREKNTHI